MNTNAPEISHHDVVVVGARCAGASTARLLAARGHDVVVVDRAELPSDTLSTHAILRTGVVQLHRWGLLDRLLAAGTPAIHDVIFHDADGVEPSVARVIKHHAGVGHLVAPRRTVLDALLAEAAQEAGARLMLGTTVDGVTRDDDGRITGVRARRGGSMLELRARLVIGADGLRSRIARSVGAELVESCSSDSATHYVYVAGDWPAIEYYARHGSFAGIFPTNDGEACIWVCEPADQAEATRRDHPDITAAFWAMLEGAAPELAARVRAGVVTSTPRGMLRLPNHRRRSHGPGWALVGDAGYHRDAITGHGISDAFRDAELLARHADRFLAGEVAEAEALGDYERTRDLLLARIFEITVELSQYPEPARFGELQRELARAIEEEAAELAAWPSLLADPTPVPA